MLLGGVPVERRALIRSRPSEGDVEAAGDVFELNSCHVATPQTGANANPALDRVTYQPFSDFLLHDMGPVGDGIEQGSATGREIRTAPLWGLRVITLLLHDGHGRASRDRFNALSSTDRTRLLAF
ncbi:MAG: di-heme oxidoredictase family protein [Acidobacteriota bacterium]